MGSICGGGEFFFHLSTAFSVEKIGLLSVFGYVSFQYANEALHRLPNSDLTTSDFLFHVL